MVVSPAKPPPNGAVDNSQPLFEPQPRGFELTNRPPLNRLPTLISNRPTNSRSSETGGLQRDQFVKHSKSHAKCYGLHPNQARPARSESFWHCDSTKLNSAYSRIARSSELTSLAPTSRTLSQDTHRHWEKAARESTYVCNQVAGLSRCLSEVQQSMQTQL